MEIRRNLPIKSQQVAYKVNCIGGIGLVDGIEGKEVVVVGRKERERRSREDLFIAVRCESILCKCPERSSQKPSLKSSLK